jgi:hypothetical protein
MLINTGLKTHKTTRLVIPSTVGMALVAIFENMPNKKMEFGVYLKGHWDAETATVTVEENIYLPKQSVTPVHIQFLEEPPDYDWNVVVHRHPPGFERFSQIDKNELNDEFLASAIFLLPWSWPDAIINIPLQSGVKYQARASVVCKREYTLPKNLDLENIMIRNLSPEEEAFHQINVSEAYEDALEIDELIQTPIPRRLSLNPRIGRTRDLG